MNQKLYYYKMIWKSIRRKGYRSVMKRKKGYEKIAILLMVFILFIGVLPVPDALAGTQNKKVHVKLKLDTKELVWLSGEETELKITGSVDKSSRVAYFTQDMEGNKEAILHSENLAKVSKKGKFSILIEDVPEYDTTYYIYAIDKKNHIAKKKVSYCIDEETPVITQMITDDLVFSKDTYYAMKDTINVRVIASDMNGSGIKEICIYRDGELIEKKLADENGEASFEVPLDKKEESKNCIYASATDFVGNVTDEEWNSSLNNGAPIVYDGSTPHISFLSTTDEYHVGHKTYITGEAEFLLNVKTDVSDIKSVEVKVNGQNLKTDYHDKKFENLKEDEYFTGNMEQQYVISTLQFPETLDNKYEINITVTNIAGRKYQTTYYVYRDTDAPVLESVIIPKVAAEAGQVFYEKGEKYGYYTNKEVKAIVTMDDGGNGSGVKKSTWYLVDENGKKHEEKTAKGKQAKIEIPSRFKGFIYVRAEDWLGNVSSCDYTASGIISENGNLHKQHCDIQLKTQKSTAMDKKGNALYRNNINVDVVVKDSYSGIRKVEWSVQAPHDSNKNYEGVCEVSNEGVISDSDWEVANTQSNLVTELHGNLPVKNNSNDIVVTVKMTDRAGNISKKTINMSIDKTNPEVSVNFHDDSQKAIYKEKRVATVQVRERNFDEQDVKFSVKNTDHMMPVVSEWKEIVDEENPDNTLHIATLEFDQDGEYELEVNYKDLAGRKAEKSEVQKFTIDKTSPMIEIDMHSEKGNGFYYAKAPTATIRITEKNFDANKVKVKGNVKGANNKKVKFPTVSGWKKQDDVYTATITFKQDSVYKFSINATDMAGNKSEAYKVGEFCVDQTKPEVKISGVTDNAAYNGTVKPTINISDVNLSSENVHLKLVGANRGEVNLDNLYEVSENKSGKVIRFSDFAKEKMVDDLYTLTVDGTDRAGNRIKKNLHFSVNRFGSVYSMEDSLKSISGTYVKKASDIVVTETNVDELDAQSIKVTLFQNGNPKDLMIDQDYTVTKSGGNGKWSQYQYTIDKKNFLEDGSYSVVISSMDKAGNTNENDDSNKGMEISFGVDATKPAVMPINVKQSETYSSSKLEAGISIIDNLLLKDVEILLNGKKVVYTKDGDNYVIAIPESNTKQKISVIAKDAAGNISKYDISDLLITSNAIVRWYNNKPVFWTSIGCGSIVIVLIGVLIGLLRRNVIHKGKNR